jgi:dihydrodipicolinate synthase/N-acetylneuraminate lyase
MAGRYEEARDLQRRVQDIDAVMLPYKAAGMKAAMNLLGLKGTQPRRPNPPMPTAEVERLQKVMRESGLLKD